jgi:outer membrane protein OmpA-like peptidoglycan-associated protein
MALVFVGIFFYAQIQIFATENGEVDSNLSHEVATLRTDVEELKVLVSGMKAELSARRSELTNLKAQIQQEQNTLTELRRQVAREREALAMLQTGTNSTVSAQTVSAVDSPKSVQKTGGTILLQTVYFAPDSSNVDAYYVPALDRIGKQMVNTPNMKIVVRGFTNAAGTTEGQRRVSRERAEQTAQFLRRNYGITADRIALEWVGAAEFPSAPNVEMTDKTRRAVQVFMLQ